MGLSGEDAALLGARRRGTLVDGEEVDLGLVGDVESVNPSAILDILDARPVPVVSTVAPDLDVDGQVLNVNADTAAAAIAVALGAEKPVVLTDVEGIYADWPDRRSLLSTITVSAARDLLTRSTRAWSPSSRRASAPSRGASADARGRRPQPHSILLEIFTDEGIGTMVLPDITGSEPSPGLPAPSPPRPRHRGRP